MERDESIQVDLAVWGRPVAQCRVWCPLGIVGRKLTGNERLERGGYGAFFSSALIPAKTSFARKIREKREEYQKRSTPTQKLNICLRGSIVADCPEG